MRIHQRSGRTLSLLTTACFAVCSPTAALADVPVSPGGPSWTRPPHSVALPLNLRGHPEEPVMVYVRFAGVPAAELVSSAAELADATKMDEVRLRVEQLRREHALLVPHIESLGGEVVADLTRLANALQVDIPAGSVSRLLRLPGVESVERVPLFYPSTATAVPRVGAYPVWGANGLGATGKGVRVGIIDTGIDYLHADLGGAGDPEEYKNNDRTVIETGTFPTARVVGGWDFVGDTYNGGNSPHPDPDPLDCFSNQGGWISGGHGSHVAGIVAGNGVLEDGTAYTGPYQATLNPFLFRIGPGPAPEASLYALKVFGCDGGTTMVAAALEWVADPNNDGDFSDRLDVVNMSLGSSFDYLTKLDNQQLANLAKLGASVVVAAGNDGDTFFTVGSPSTHLQVISVAATNDGPLFHALEVVAPDSIAGLFACAEGNFTAPLKDTGPVTGQLVQTAPLDACTTLTNASEISGKIALLDRGGCSNPAKFQNLEAAGAIAAVVVDSLDSDVPTVMSGDGTWTSIPGVLVRKVDGQKIRQELSKGVTIKLDPNLVYSKSLGADNMTEFSSRGPRSSDLALKPDLAAPGGGITSVAVSTGNQAATMSGTSMACPVAAGGVALLRSLKPTLPPLDLKAVLMNTTDGVAKKPGTPTPVSFGGAGRMRLDRAATSDLSASAASPSGAVSVSFGSVVAFETWTDTRKIVISNRGEAPQTLSVATEPTYALAGVTASTDVTQVVVPAKGSAEISLKLEVDPALLPVAEPDPHTSATQYQQSRQFLVEAAGHVRFDAATMPDNPLRVAYHATVRAASNRSAGTVPHCLTASDGSLQIALEGSSKHPDPLTTAFELAAISPDDGLDPKWADLLALGVSSNIATADSFEEASLYFGIAVAGDWTTPAIGPTSVVGVAIDTNLDGGYEYAVVAEAFSKDGPYLDVIAATLYDLGTEEVVNQRYANMFPRSDRDTELFNNSVLVLPVTIGSLGLVQGASRIAFYAFTQDNFSMTERDVTDTVEWDPAQSLINTAKGGDQGRPVYGSEPVVVGVDWKAKGATPLPSVLLLHHTNLLENRFEVLDLAKASPVPSSDVALKSTPPTTLPAPQQQIGVETLVSNLSSTPAGGVKVVWTKQGDGDVVSATTTVGKCTGTTCELGDLAGASSAKVVWQVRAGTTGIAASVSATSSDGCEVNAADNTVKVQVGVKPVQPQNDAGPVSDAAPATPEASVTPTTDEATVGGGSCNCVLSGPRTSNHSFLGLASLASLIGLARWRERNSKKRFESGNRSGRLQNR